MPSAKLVPVRLLILFQVLLIAATSHAQADAEPESDRPAAHAGLKMEGWTVKVDLRLLKAPNKALGDRARALLRAKLAGIATVVSEPILRKLQEVTIWLDLNHGGLTSMQYHPDSGWLVQNGYKPALAKGMHIPVAANFLSARHQQVQPWCVLHELAHAYHDQVLTFEHAEIKAAWEVYKASGHGERALHVNGTKVRHYALTNHKEFFAEMSEAYFGTNDFFPFVHGELKEAEPEVFSLLRRVWGEVPVETGG